MDLAERYAGAVKAGARGDLGTGLPSICRRVTLSKCPVAKYPFESRLLGLPPPAASSSPHPSDSPYALSRKALDVESLLAEIAQLREALAASQSECDQVVNVLDVFMGQAEAGAGAQQGDQQAGGTCEGAAADTAASDSFAEGYSLQLEETSGAFWQQEQQAACQTPTRAKAGSWEQQSGGQAQQVCATPSDAIFPMHNALETLQYEQYLEQMGTPTPLHTSSSLQQLPSCPLVAAAPPACAPAASSGLWAEGSAGLPHATAPAAVLPEYRLFGEEADIFGAALREAALAAVPQACVPTAAAGAAAGGTTSFASFVGVPPACAPPPAAASPQRWTPFGTGAGAGSGASGAAAGGTTTFASFAEGYSRQLEEVPEASWQQQPQPQQQAACETLIRAGCGAWERERGEQGQQACAAPSHDTFSIFYPFTTMMPQRDHQQQQQQQVIINSSTLPQLPSCPLVAAAPPAFAPAASSGLWAEGYAGLDHACASAAPPLGRWPLGASPGCLAAALRMAAAAARAAMPQACAPTAAAGAAGGGTTSFASSADAPRACAPAAASSPQRWKPFGTCAGAGAVGPHLLLAATAVAQAAVSSAIAAAPGTCGSGGSWCGLAARSHCHVSQPAAHVHADAHRHTAAATSHSHVARQPGQESASFAVLRTPLRTPFGLRSRLPPMRFVCTPAGVKGGGCWGGGGK